MIKTGDIIRIRRQELKFSQEELAFGLCNHATLSRIESGNQDPSRSVFEAIMQRLGLSRSRYNIFADGKELNIYNLRYEIDCELATFNYHAAKGLLTQLEFLVTPKDKANWQYVLFIQALMNRERDDYEAELIAHEQALAITQPCFFEKEPARLLLTLTECGLLKSMARCLHHLGDTAHAIEIIQKLIVYMEYRFVDPFEMTTTLIELYENVSKYKGLSGDYSGSVHDANMGIELCKKYGRLHDLPHLLLNSGCSRYYQDKASLVGVSEMKQAYVLFSILEDSRNKHIIENFFEAEGLALTK